MKVPLVACRSIGFLGYLRLQVQEHTVIESHPDNENPDLRLDKPWPALREYLDQIDVEKLDTKERTHVPALVIVHYYLNKYRESHNGALPKTRAEKNELRRLIETSLPAGEKEIMGENYAQALHIVNTSVGPTVVPSNVQAILDDSNCRNLTEEVSSKSAVKKTSFLALFLRIEFCLLGYVFCLARIG